MRARRRAGTVVLCMSAGMALAGCGPSQSGALGVRNVELDLALGHEATPTPAQAPGPAAAGPAPAPGGFLAPVLPAIFGKPLPSLPSIPRPTPSIPPPVLGTQCPDAPQTTASKYAATPEVTTAQPMGDYAFRSTGTRTLGTTTKPLTAAGVHSVSASGSQGTGRFGFTDSQSSPLPSTVAVFASQDQDANQTGVAFAGQQTSQLGLASLRITVGSEQVSFSPPAPVVWLKTPAQPGTAWKSAGTDPVSGTTVSVDASITKQVRVNVCGLPLDAWEVQSTMTIVSASSTDVSTGIPDGQQTNLTRTLTYDVATGYGGLTVALTEQTSGTLDGQAYTDDHLETLNALTPTPTPSPSPKAANG